MVLAADIGATNVRTAIVAGDGSVRHRHSARTGDDPVPVLLDCLRRSAEAGETPRPHGVSIAALGPLDYAAGAIDRGPTLLPGSGPLRLAGPVRAATGLDVVLERDTTVAALGEAVFGAARGYRDFVYLTVSSGIGAAVVLDGRFLTGVHGQATEVGHLPLRLDGPRCVCGLHGCLEVLASGSGIAAAAGDGRDAAAVVAAAVAGDAVAARILGRAREAFAAALVGLVNTFDPGLIVIGGSVALGQGDEFLDAAREAVRRHAYGAAARETRIVPAALADDAGLIGGVALLAAHPGSPAAQGLGG